ncbi:hypothetical protein D1AOALGA4SA_3339 [Olavius algarvensis Delta 1 endosymbiont]|nr:hypothetical protein D1AOALGA4SA_3339 [Olavius algarvensis Delta 1 endosymbiont]
MLRIMSNKVQIKTEKVLGKSGRCRAARSLGRQKCKVDVAGVRLVDHETLLLNIKIKKRTAEYRTRNIE